MSLCRKRPCVGSRTPPTRQPNRSIPLKYHSVNVGFLRQPKIIHHAAGIDHYPTTEADFSTLVSFELQPEEDRASADNP
ncbi:uncharacterized protein MYCFIDRAFT_169633 [Pseudocercospora fijiensis CIRAD86]|uniref:Uncharacterized protein n=1 Tax=Pseudocercospora fijiensis (strain CIRAD86) TaxID=383855 RepID=N1QAF2_PSEFD|nr:uncharacterized protein MYCFIDRAFT_169633 [Pseudocercospora fijiensis CIRAD86]EME87903.1 hypothetical protein MYCFIDRAFT_169633 [Pseudocercospora fijiensis CIRAD86]